MSTIRPWSMIATRSQSRSASSIRCVVRKTVLPRSRMPRTRSQIARRACGSSPVVSSSRKTTSGSLTSASAMNKPLLLSARERHEPGVALVRQAELVEQTVAVDRALPVQRRPQIDGLPHLDALLQLRLLQLDADPLLQRVDVAHGIEAEDRDACRGPASAGPRRTPSSSSCRRRWDRSGRRSRRRGRRTTPRRQRRSSRTFSGSRKPG